MDWQHDLPRSAMPTITNPAEGKIVSANHRIEPPDFPHNLGDIYVAGWRAQAIHDALDAAAARGERLGIAECQVLQCDFRCIPGERLRQHFRALSPPIAER
jgi:penicillin amidase|eukprot:COSAG01_NODE_7035_length_3382_cov_4.177535_4_plen_101_part_00